MGEALGEREGSIKTRLADSSTRMVLFLSSPHTSAPKTSSQNISAMEAALFSGEQKRTPHSPHAGCAGGQLPAVPRSHRAEGEVSGQGSGENPLESLPLALCRDSQGLW